MAERGFDRGADYIDTKTKLIESFNDQYEKYTHKPSKVRPGKTLIYIMIATIQLRDGSRISEAINAFKKFIIEGIDKNVEVKIAKSGGTRYKIVDGVKTEYQKKDRSRSMMFPKLWFDEKKLNFMMKKITTTHQKEIDLPVDVLRKRVHYHMLQNYDINTHSLRYAFINYMLHDLKTGMNEVAKFVGHTNTNQLVTYTQRKYCNEIFKIDM